MQKEFCFKVPFLSSYRPLNFPKNSLKLLSKMYNPRAYTQHLFQISLWMHLHYHHHHLLDWYPGKNNLSVTHNQKYIKLIMPLQLM